MMTIGWLGCAHIHTPGFVKKVKDRAAEVNVKSVWDHDAARAKANAEALGSVVVSEVGAILSDPEIDAVVVCSETNRHAELVLAVAKAKKHMFVEKPLGMGAKDAWGMAKAIEKAGVIFQTGYFNRGAPVHRFLRDEIKAGHFGTITRARHSNCHKGSLAGWFDKEWRWMADPAVAGCGAYGDLGTHSLDILMWLFGDVTCVAASIGVVTRRYGDCDETGEGLIEFKNGVLGTLAGGWVDVANPVRMLISGTEGHAVVVNNDLFYQSSHVDGADGKQPWTKLPEALPHAFDLFLDAVAGKKDVPLVTPSEAAARSAVMEALYAAAKSHRWVVPKYPRKRPD